jgi:hypothetical protein
MHVNCGKQSLRRMDFQVAADLIEESLGVSKKVAAAMAG